MTRPRSLLLLVLWLAAMPAAAQTSYRVTVSAGDFARRGTLVTFELPAPGVYRLVDAQGREVPLQVDPRGRATFVLDRLEAGASRHYALAPADGSTAADTGGVRLEEAQGRLTFLVDGAPVATYHAAPSELPRSGIDPVYRRGGYLHPVFTPAGRLVTDDYPPDHLHHHGVWAAWTRTTFQGRRPDFWNMGDRTGTVEPVGVDTSWSGPVHAGVRARHRYVDLSADAPVVALHETWEVTVYDLPAGSRPYRVFDLTVVQETATDDSLGLPTYHYGGVGLRGHRTWNGAENAFFLTSEGKDRSNGHATRARWCHVGGLVDGALAGIAVLGHPDNYEAPQPMRIHPDEPFFNFAPSQAGDWAIRPGEPYVARYRFVTSDGPPNAADLERLWHDFAFPPQVKVE